MWQSQYGTRDHDDAEDDFEVIYQRGFIAQYDPSIFRLKRPISAVRCWFITAAIIVSVAVVTILSISLASPDESQSIVNRSDFSFLQSADQSKSAATCSRDAISLSVSNEYGTYTGPYPYLTANGGMQLVEPYKATTLVLNDPSSCIRTGATLQWQIFDSESKELIFFTKSNKLSTSIKLVRTGNYEIVVKLSSRSSTPTIFFTGKITCK